MALRNPNFRRLTVSQYFRLGVGQSELDFVDVDVRGDTPLFVDPHALRTSPTEWAERCVDLIQSFFTAVISAIRSGDHGRAHQLLCALSEPNETHLGLSTGVARGRALGYASARKLWRALTQSKAVQSGLLLDLEDTALLVEGINHDIISDIATNIMREPLIEYTQQMCTHYGIPMTPGVASGPLWNSDSEEWSARFERLPVVSGRRLLLVPKVIVRSNLAYDQGEYYRAYILPRLQEAELRASGSLVRLLKNGRVVVRKKDVSAKFGTGKSAIVRFTQEHPETLVAYREAKRAKPTQPLGHNALSDLVGGQRVDFDSLLKDVIAIPKGRDSADQYHRAVERLLSAIFYPSLSHPTIEEPIHGGRKRIDIVYTNTAASGFFQWLAAHYEAPHVFVECKNYAGDPANPELDQLSGRFSKRRGVVGILACRTFKNKELFQQRCRDTADDDRGFIIVLDDDDLAELVESRKAGDRSDLFNLLKERFDRLVM